MHCCLQQPPHAVGLAKTALQLMASPETLAADGTLGQQTLPRNDISVHSKQLSLIIVGHQRVLPEWGELSFVFFFFFHFHIIYKHG